MTTGRFRVRYMNSQQAAEYIGLGAGVRAANLIRQMVHRDTIPYIKIGSRLRFDVVEIDQWMQKRKVRALDA